MAAFLISEAGAAGQPSFPMSHRKKISLTLRCVIVLFVL
jgi:hypothetical protein